MGPIPEGLLHEHGNILVIVFIRRTYPTYASSNIIVLLYIGIIGSIGLA